MIELKITVEDALRLLLDRMKFELLMRQKAGFINPLLKMDYLSYKDLLSIVEASVFDTLLLLPLDFFSAQSNLNSIVTSTVRALAKVFNRPEFLLYSDKQSHTLLRKITDLINKHTLDKQFLQN